MQAFNFTKQDMVKGMILHVVNKVRGYPPNRSVELPARISINNGFFPDQGVRNYEFIPFGITSIRGLELGI
jgi:hypothetical protein